MKIAYFIPHTNTIYAGRTINAGYRNAFKDLGHEFEFLTADHNQKEFYDDFSPDILFTGLNSYVLKFLDLNLLKKQKSKGTKVFVSMPLWISPMASSRINETPGMSTKSEWIDLIKSDNFGDVYFNAIEENDERMQGFEKTTGYKHYTIPLAADKLNIYPEYSEKFKSDISYIGTYLPEKRNFIQNQVFPLKNKYDLQLYGQDWTFSDRSFGFISKIGKYFNLPIIKDIQKPKLNLDDERKIYTSSQISINIHEDYQKKYGGDCNERTFKIPLARGFQISDDVACIKKYFEDGKEIIIAKDKKEWFDKIDYYMKNPDKRDLIIEAGHKKVMEHHTYHNRVQSLLNIYGRLK